jgi:hypothetical protein
MRKSGPMPEYTIPILGHMTATFSSIESSIKIDDDFFSVAITIPLDAYGKDVGSRFNKRVNQRKRHTFDTEACCSL